MNAITTYPNARHVAAESASTLTSSTKSNNAQTRENKVNAAEKIYDNTSVTASTAYSVGAFNAWTTYLTTATNAGVSYEDAVKAAGDTYTNSVLAAWGVYVDKANMLDHAYKYAIAAIANNPNFDGAGYIDGIANGQGNYSTPILCAFSDKNPTPSATLPKSEDTFQKLTDYGTGCYLIIFTHTRDNGHGWMGVAKVEKDKAGKAVVSDFCIKGWAPTRPGNRVPGQVSDHKDVQYEMARYFPINDATYKKLVDKMNSYDFDGEKYTWQDSNCLHWCENVIKGAGCKTIFPNEGTLSEERYIKGVRSLERSITGKLYPLMIQRYFNYEISDQNKPGHIPK